MTAETLLGALLAKVPPAFTLFCAAFKGLRALDYWQVANKGVLEAPFVYFGV